MASLGLIFGGAWFLLPVGGLVFIYGLSACWGALAFPREHESVRTLFGLLGAMAMLAVVGGGVYFAYALDRYSMAVILVLSPWLLAPFSLFRRPEADKPPLADLVAVERSSPVDTYSLVLLMMTAAFDLAALRWLLGAATAEAIRSPWDIVPPIYFLWVFLGTFALTAACYRNRYHHFVLAALSFHFFTLISPALVVYKEGFGFDPFIHAATERLISLTGSVTPKPPYYLGQYALVTIISRMFILPVEAVDRLLLPAMSAIFAPLGAIYLLRRGFKLDRQLTTLSAFGVFLLPLSIFIATTPQGLADLFALETVLLGVAWLNDHRPAWPFVALLAAAALAIHPLAGLPAVFFLGFATVFKIKTEGKTSRRWLKGVLSAVLAAAAVAALPVMFVLNAARGGAASPLFPGGWPGWQAIWSALPFGAPSLATRYRPLLDFAQMLDGNRDWVIILLAAAGAVILLRSAWYRRGALALTAACLTSFAAAFILKAGLKADRVIAYEQADYGNRLYALAFLMAAPLILAALAWWWRAARKSDPALGVFTAVVVAAVVTAAGFAAFPRHDDFVTDRGYSVSSHDLAAAKLIDSTASGDYIVLANQSVSAAALKEFGFKRYFGDQFYYPIPTGGALYQYYLKMVYDGPKRETMDEAMDSVGVSRAFFVVDDYWTGAEKLVAAAKADADGWQSVDDGKLYVFEYKLRD